MQQALTNIPSDNNLIKQASDISNLIGDKKKSIKYAELLILSQPLSPHGYKILVTQGCANKAADLLKLNISIHTSSKSELLALQAKLLLDYEVLFEDESLLVRVRRGRQSEHCVIIFPA
jgi:hypothetical protein